MKIYHCCLDTDYNVHVISKAGHVINKSVILYALFVCLCLTSHQQLGHLEMGTPIYCLLRRT